MLLFVPSLRIVLVECNKIVCARACVRSFIFASAHLRNYGNCLWKVKFFLAAQTVSTFVQLHIPNIQFANTEFSGKKNYPKWNDTNSVFEETVKETETSSCCFTIDISWVASAISLERFTNTVQLNNASALIIKWRKKFVKFYGFLCVSARLYSFYVSVKPTVLTY